MSAGRRVGMSYVSEKLTSLVNMYQILKYDLCKLADEINDKWEIGGPDIWTSVLHRAVISSQIFPDVEDFVTNTSRTYITLKACSKLCL